MASAPKERATLHWKLNLLQAADDRATRVVSRAGTFRCRATSRIVSRIMIQTSCPYDGVFRETERFSGEARERRRSASLRRESRTRAASKPRCQLLMGTWRTSGASTGARDWSDGRVCGSAIVRRQPREPARTSWSTSYTEWVYRAYSAWGPVGGLTDCYRPLPLNAVTRS